MAASIGCFIGGRQVALKLADVREIIRLPATTKVPRSADCLRGLADLRGRVLPVVDLAVLLHQDSGPDGDETRVVVLAEEAGGVGLAVDRVGGMMDTADDDATIRMIEPLPLLRDAFRRLDAAKLPSQRVIQAEPRPQAAAEKLRELVSFSAGGQVFALDIGAIAEITALPTEVIKLAHSSPALLGVAARGGSLLPLVSLRRLLGLADTPETSGGRLVVVRHAAFGLVGLVVEQSGRVLRVPPARCHPVPALLSQDTAQEVEAICRTAGDALVSILSPERLFSAAEGTLPAPIREEHDMADTHMTSSSGAQRFVVYLLGADEFAVPIERTEEVLRLPETLTPVPGAPGAKSFIAGVMQIRGTVLPVIDQRRRFGLPPQPATGREAILVHRLGGRLVGFIVDRVIGILAPPATALEPAPELSDDNPLVCQVINLPTERRLILVIDPDLLLADDENAHLANPILPGSGPILPGTEAA
jgi:purine-binding chemotaxis protein CheW